MEFDIFNFMSSFLQKYFSFFFFKNHVRQKIKITRFFFLIAKLLLYSQADVEVSSLWSIYGHVLFIECSDSYIMQNTEKMARNFYIS